MIFGVLHRYRCTASGRLWIIEKVPCAYNSRARLVRLIGRHVVDGLVGSLSTGVFTLLMLRTNISL